MIYYKLDNCVLKVDWENGDFWYYSSIHQRWNRYVTIDKALITNQILTGKAEELNEQELFTELL